MKGLLIRLSCGFTAGTLGALANSAAIWYLGISGLTTAWGVAITPEWTAAWVYPRLVWGGIWGMLFIPAFLSRSVVRRGLLYSLAPSAVQLFIIFPTTGHATMGTDLGAFTPLVVLSVNGVWGLVGAFWISFSENVNVTEISLPNS